MRQFLHIRQQVSDIVLKLMDTLRHLTHQHFFLILGTNNLVCKYITLCREEYFNINYNNGGFAIVWIPFSWNMVEICIHMGFGNRAFSYFNRTLLYCLEFDMRIPLADFDSCCFAIQKKAASQRENRVRQHFLTDECH